MRSGCSYGDCRGWCAGGDLSNFIKEHENALTHVDEALVLRWLAQLLEALEYLHSDRHILHRDIKTQNIFLDETKSNVKLGDFGIARCLDSTGEMASTVIGMACLCLSAASALMLKQARRFTCLLNCARIR